ncbi:AAEL004795-PA [Aedes aegypti]|uniref:AAEL004795-PA n=1 Tax=Aedes aegypti TaxID=7159 RepID=Q17BV6_AEDAE|nr:AAEL004795-PA [Aedes aegypti]
MEWVFIDNKMADANEQKASFLAACGKEVYSELFPGKDLKTVSFKEITDSLKKRYNKTESDMIQRYKFYQRVQGPTESAWDFILAVKLQAELCEFGEFKDIAIRDKLVCGTRDPDVQQRFFFMRKL